MMDGYSFFDELVKNIGQVVTIFTTSGGESGRGFTGVLSNVSCGFVRLVTQIGPGPGCALGNCCDKPFSMNDAEGAQEGEHEKPDCRPDNVGSVVDIPIDRIAAFVHNAVGSH